MERKGNFTVYKSSAGSGKTFTLVKQYLLLALESDAPFRYTKILAITFTNKAATEMKERIISALTAIASGNGYSGTTKVLVNELKKELNEDEVTIRNRANKTLVHILHHYSDFAISTIDKFVYKIVRTFAYDLKIPLNFEVELDSNQLISNAVDQLIAKVGSNKDLTKALVQFIENKADNEKSWNIEKDISSYASNLLNENGQFYATKLKHISLTDFFSIKSDIKKQLVEFESQISSLGEEALTLINSHSISVGSLAGGKNGIIKYFEYLKKVRLDKLTPSNTVLKYVSESKLYSSKCHDIDRETIQSITPSLLNFFYRAQEIIEKEHSTYVLLSLINKNIYSLAILNEIEKTINSIKHEENIVHISEFNQKIAQIVFEEPVPFIYERLGERYQNYLIDEFQDTSKLQWQNILPLIDNSLAYGNFNMLVGDGKQAIYRWRGGEVEQFANLPKVIAEDNENFLVQERADSLARNYKEEILGTNYRSKTEIIEFNNWFFTKIVSVLSSRHHTIYESAEQKMLPEKTDGLVSIKVLQATDREEYYNETLLLVKERIKQSQKDGYRLSDIAILCRKNSDAAEIANFLVEHGIPVISSESLLLKNSSQVRLLIALLQYLNDESDIYSRVHIAHYLYNEDDSELHTILENISSKNSSFLNYLSSKGMVLKKDYLLTLSLFELVESLIRIFNINRSVNPYVLAFLEFTFDFSTKNDASIDSFLRQWSQKEEKLSVSTGEEGNAVSIMTIHKSKGLQFPVVIFPFANWKTNSLGAQLWLNMENDTSSNLPAALVPYTKLLETTVFSESYENEKSKILLDNINILYVAFTRPEDRLYVITSKDKRKDLSNNFIPFLMESENWDKETYSFRLGEEQLTTMIDSPPDLPKYEIEKTTFPHWKPRVKISLTAGEVWDLENNNKQRDYGQLLHYVLAKITTPKEVLTVLSELKLKGVVTQENFPSLKKDINTILSHPELVPYFSGEYTIKNESEIILEDGQTIRPDRVMIKGDDAVILDYKTGLMDKNHHKQLTGYASALKAMGYNRIEKYLFYTESNTLVQV